MYNRPPMPLPDQAQQQPIQNPPPVPPKKSKINSLVSKFKNMNTHNKSSSAPSSAPTHSSPVNSKDDIFSASISNDEPLSIFSRSKHPVNPPANNDSKPIGTNKFYSNMLLENQNNAVWTQPYSLWFSKDENYHGLAVHHVPASSRVSGPDAGADPVQFFFGPNGIKSFVFGSTDFNDTPSLSLENIKHMSADAKFQSKSQGYMTVPLVQGQGFITSIYFNLIPKLSSAVGFASVSGDKSPRSGINKYKIGLNDGTTWVLYVTIPNGQSLDLAQKDGNNIVGSNSVNGAVFQLVKGDSGVYNDAAGSYPTRAHLTNGSVSDKTGSFSISYDITGSSNSGKTLLFALPHQVDTFTSDMDSAKTDLKLDTITKGTATAYLTDTFKFSLNVPSNISLDPYSSIDGVSLSYSGNVLQKIRDAASSEVNGDVEAESNVDSMYFAGKVLAKYAWILYVTKYVLKDDGLTNTLLPKVKSAIERFSKNQQQLPLSYDETWKGIISTGDSSADFGNSYYNDHHFHYGYHVLSSAIVGKIDKEQGGNWVDSVKGWVNDLARDFASTSDDDQYFPAFRSFDWYNGHSWAKGVFASGDGKDQESSSEDYNAYYSLKIWADVINDNSLKQRSEIMLGILNHSINHYFLLADDNNTQPKNFIKNKVTGILFENKVDHTTYFGNNLEYIQMIHAIPVTSFSSFIRKPKFCKEEWDQKLKGIVNNVNDGWKGIIYLNVALFDPNSSWNFFSGDGFKNDYLDGGQSKTWSLTYSGAFASA